MEAELRYLVIGAGGTGGCISAYLAAAGEDVTLIVRGDHGAAIKQNGIKIIRPHDTMQVQVKSCEAEEYCEKADVIFVCVKGYSLEQTYPLIRRAAHEETVVIPILNIYGTGERMAAALPGLEVLNGCIYIAAAIEQPGVLRQSGEIFRIVYGRVDGRRDNPVLHKIAADLQQSGITPIFSANVRRDTLRKFSFVSPMAAVGAWLDTDAGGLQKTGPARKMFIDCIKEVEAVAGAIGITFDVDLVETNLNILDALEASFTASMQKDLKKGGATEMDGLIFEVVRLGCKLNVPVPVYQQIAAKWLETE